MMSGKSAIIALALLMSAAISGCGSKGYDREEAEALCAIHDSAGTLDYGQINQMIAQEQLALAEIRAEMENLLKSADTEKFSEHYSLLAADTAFVGKVAMSERMWRILVLSQGQFSEDNREKFMPVTDLRKIVDMLNDDIVDRRDK